MKKISKLFVILLALTFALSLFAACGGEQTPPQKEGKYSIVFDYNYDGAPESLVIKSDENVTVAKPQDPVRDGYDFDAWYTDEACVIPYDFSSLITGDLTLYAGWLESGVTYHTVTYDVNYDGGESYSQRVKDGARAVRPDGIEREGYDLFSWYKDEECTQEFSFARDKITADVTLYALWGKTEVFEAENINFDELEGPGYSSSASGTSMILRDRDGAAGASGGYYVSYLYKNGIALEFHIISEKAVDNARLTLRLTAEVKNNIVINGDTYVVEVNGERIDYPDILFTGVGSSGTGSGSVRPFTDHLITTSLSLVEGENVIRLITNNDMPMGGIMNATAPMVDCIKISSVAGLSWGEGFPIKNKG